MHDVPSCPLWFYKEAACYLGLSVTKLAGMVAARQVPHIRLGRLVRFRKQDLDDYLEKLAKESVRPMMDEAIEYDTTSRERVRRTAPGIRPIKP